jgi:putative transposase
VPGATYIVTARTLNKAHFFAGDERLRLLTDALSGVAADYGWLLHAWAVFANHYHFIARAPEDGPDVGTLAQRLHSQTARAVNALDGTPGRHVWFQYRDTCLTFEKSYLARLNYVMNNPVHHRVAPVADLYPYCSAAWFAAEADPAFRRKVESFRYDRLNLEDDF